MNSCEILRNSYLSKWSKNEEENHHPYWYLVRSRTDVLFVFADQWRTQATGYFGNPDIRTPNLDQMAAEGIRFNRFYAGAPVCSPTRASCLTGRNGYRMGILSANIGHLPPEEVTLAEVLKKHGYATGHFGKWHMGGQRDVDDAPPITAYGFDASLTNFEGMGPKLLPLTLKPGEPEKRVFIRNIPVAAGARDGWYRARVTLRQLVPQVSHLDLGDHADWGNARVIK